MHGSHSRAPTSIEPTAPAAPAHEDPLGASREFAWRQDPQGLITWLSPSAQRLRGCASQEVLGRPWRDLFSAQGQAQLDEAMCQGLHSFRAALCCQDGSERWFDLTLGDLRDDQGRLLGRQGLARDINDLMLLQAQLQRSERRTLDLGETASEGIAVVQDSLFKFVNRHLQEFIGHSADELLQKPFIDYIHEDDRDLLRENHRRRLAGLPVPSRYEFRVLTRSRGVRWLEMSGSLIEWEGRPASINYINDVTVRKELEEQVRQMAFFDALTGLPNRRLLEDRLAQALVQCQRSGDHGALLFVDLDNFKALNDQHGHAAGDLLLAAVAQRLKASVRASDSVARLGGDEFVVMLTPLPPDVAQAASLARRVAEKIRTTLAAEHRLALRGNETGDHPVQHHCSASIGLTLFGPADSGTQAVLKRADQAMYRAKGEGRNRVQVAA